MQLSIAAIAEADLPAILALNNANAAATSVLDLAELRQLVSLSYYARGIGSGVDGFLIAMAQDADYHSPNFHWLRERFARFAYIDRIVIDEQARGGGLARALYEDLFEMAHRDGHDRVLCEVNFQPPNPASDAFHAKLGFEVIGQAQPYGDSKTVRYYQRLL